MWNNHGGFDGGYGGSGMGGGGGYMQSPGGFGSPAPTQGEKKSRSRAQQIVPCTVSQLLSATQSDEVFRIGEVELSQVTLVGVVRHAEKAPTNILYKVDDMTAAPMDIRQWVDTDETSCENMVVPPGSYVKVAGHLRSFQNKKSVVAFKIAPIEDMNEFVSHMLEVVQSHMTLNAQGTACLLSARLRAGGYTENQIKKARDAVDRLSRGDLISQTFTQVMNKNHVTRNGNKNQPLTFVTDYSKEFHKPLGGASAMAHSTPGRIGMGESGGTFTGGNDMQTNGLTPHQSQILNLIKSCRGSEGMAFEDLKKRLHGMNVNTIKQAVEFLSNEGHIYSTVDDEHYKSTDAD